MNQLDIYYRALVDYRANTKSERECVAQRNAVTKVNTESDRITVKRMICTVDEDWVNAIEEGLVHIEKAINEQRQFIRSNGEVVPIEKVKHVSKDSVEHLAKHSNLITRQVEGQDIILEHLYTVERLSDFAVYENRFLYMLLCYLRDFITLRYNNILESSNTYDANMSMNKQIKINKRTISYNVNLTEIRKDDEYLRKHNEAKEIIDRIDLLLKAVIAFLSTPLMEDAAKAPMLKPPITKTNVLKMNNNFKGAMRLYEFVTAYDKPGYTIETKIIDLNPFREQVADEIAETILLSSFLTYEYGLDIRDELQASYLEEEKRRKEEEYQKFLEKLEKVRKRVQNSGQSPEEYILMLEKQIRILEDKCAKLDAALEEIKRLKDELETELENAYADLAYQKQKYIDDMAALKAAHAEEIRQLNEAHAEEICRLNEEHAEEIRRIMEEIEQLKLEHAEEIRQLNEAHAEEIRCIMEEIEQLKEEHAEEIRQLHEKYTEEIRVLHETYAEEIRQLNEKYTEEIRLLNEKYTDEINQLNEKYTEEIRVLHETYTEEIAQLNEKYTEEIRCLNEDHAEEVRQINEKYDIETTRLNTQIECINREHATELQLLQLSHNKSIAILDNKINEQQVQIQAQMLQFENEKLILENKHQSDLALVKQGYEIEKAELDLLNAQQQNDTQVYVAKCNELEREKRIMTAQLYSLRSQLGLQVSKEDFTCKDSFDELEREFKTFKKFYKDQWKITRKSIKKSFLQIQEASKAIEEQAQQATEEVTSYDE